MGENEVRLGAGFVGPSGAALLQMLNETSIIEFTSADHNYLRRWYSEAKPELLDAIWNLHPEVHRSNVFQRHPPRNNLEAFCGPKPKGIPGYPALIKAKYVRREFAPELERLADELITLDPNLVICLGNTALWALAGKTGVSKLRGTTLTSTLLATGFKLLPTYHPAAVLRQWELRPTVIADLMKAQREAPFPEIRRPKREIWIEPTIEDIKTFRDRYIANCKLLSVDIETSGTAITEIGLAPRTSLAIVIPFTDKRRKDRSYWPDLGTEQQAWRIVQEILTDKSIPKLFQNGLYDIAFLLRAAGIAVRGAAEDTMLLHHALHPEALKGLGYLGSIYCDEGAWKVMRKHETIKRDE